MPFVFDLVFFEIFDLVFFEIYLIPQTPDIFSLADAAWKHPKYPCICILPLEFGVNIDIH